MYYLYIITLEDCPYSIAAIDLLNSLKIKYKRLKVNQKNKEKYKTKEIDTFPQIYIVKDKKKLLLGENLLLGGYSNLKEFTDIFINQEYNEENILKFHNKYKLWNKKSILRLLEIINQK
jgi:glutaredoxin-related protein